MKIVPALAAAALVAVVMTPQAPVANAQSATAQACPAFLNQEFRKLHSSESVNLCKAFAGKPMLIINTASHCGFTPQFKGLEAVHEKYQKRGLVVVGFASDDFNQEAKDEAEVRDIFKDDPFWTSGMRAGVRINRWQKAFPDRKVPI